MKQIPVPAAVRSRRRPPVTDFPEVLPNFPDHMSAMLMLFKGLAAFQVMESTACDSATALAAVERQFAAAANEQISAQNTLDHIIASCLSVVEGTGE